MRSARPAARLAGWFAVVGAFVALNYAARAAGGRPAADALYQWDTAIGTFVLYGIIAGLTLFLSLGGDRRELFALRRPGSWKRAVLIMVGVLVVTFVVAAILEPLLHGEDEQGLTPDKWDGDRAGQYVVNSIAIAGVAPIAEELLFRGLGYSLLARFGSAVAILVVGVMFGVWHGLVYALPVLALFGAGLAYLRSRTSSIYPCIVLHAVFNGAALVASVV